jgi:hypothetical protein
VVGNTIRNGVGQPVRLVGFNVSGAEYACIEGFGVFDTPDGSAPSDSMIKAMASWRGATAVRLPLNEQCWLGIAGVSSKYGGAAYRTAVSDVVNRLNAAGLVAILDLHRSAPGSGRSNDQEQMPDRDHSVDFWRSVATTFRSNTSVVFDLFNEPYPYEEADSTRAWACWRDGGCTLRSENTGQPYVAAGMNELIAAVRSTGAKTIVLAGGIYWAEMLTKWHAYQPVDPEKQLAAAFHGYSFNGDCATLSCYDKVLGPVADSVPLVAGEVGPDMRLSSDGIDDSCPSSAVTKTGFSDTLLDWMDRHHAGYTVWSWNPWNDCWSLVTGWSGTPTNIWGQAIKARLAAASWRT